MDLQYSLCIEEKKGWKADFKNKQVIDQCTLWSRQKLSTSTLIGVKILLRDSKGKVHRSDLSMQRVRFQTLTNMQIHGVVDNAASNFS